MLKLCSAKKGILRKSHKMNIKSMIKEKAKEIGFDLIGVTDPSPSKHKKAYEDWLLLGMHADMHYLELTKEVRQSPLLKFEWSKSIIVVGVNYYQGPIQNLEEWEIRISRYALGRDYHYVLTKMLSELSNYILSTTETKRTKYYTDTGPLLEKELAEKAGLGWTGKNTLLITEEFGSWVFLGVMLLDIELDPDESKKDRCRDCDLCISVCPTHALVSPYKLDSNLCTAYQTVENRGQLPDWFPSPGNTFIFGCDICQEVCPFNKDTKTTKIADFLPEEQLKNPYIEYLGGLPKDRFEFIFKDTPVDWVGYDIFMRNIVAFRKKKQEKT